MPTANALVMLAILHACCAVGVALLGRLRGETSSGDAFVEHVADGCSNPVC